MESASSEPLLSSSSRDTNTKGGFRTIPFILANEAFERVASFGLSANMIFYLKKEYQMETTTATNLLLIWSATTNVLPVIGAILADSYMGRFQIICFGSIASLLGMILLWLTTVVCGEATTNKYMLLYASLGLMSIGGGGIRASSVAFGADQIRKGDNLRKAGLLQTYFGWYSVVVTSSYIVAVTCIVYIQEHLGWTVGFGVPVVLMLLSAVSFFLASPFYVKSKVNPNLLAGLAQVVVASYRNRVINISSSQATNYEMYHRRKESKLLMPTDKLRFLNKACIIRDRERDLTPDGNASNPWSLCTVDQVEELKALIKVIPIWSTGIVFNLNATQGALGAVQGRTIDRHITTNIEIPAGSLGVFMVITLTLWIALYDRIIIPVASKFRGKPTYLSTKLRMGIGILFSITSMASWAVMECIRRQLAIKEGFEDDPEGVVDMSVLWLMPHFVMDGLAEAFYTVAGNEFFYCEFPESMSSISTSLYGVSMSASNMVASLILNAVDYFTTLGDNQSWVSDNMNKGHYDYYFWFLTGLCSVNFLYYLLCSNSYGPCKQELDNAINKNENNNSSREQC